MINYVYTFVKTSAKGQVSGSHQEYSIISYPYPPAKVIKEVCSKTIWASVSRLSEDYWHAVIMACFSVVRVCVCSRIHGSDLNMVEHASTHTHTVGIQTVENSITETYRNHWKPSPHDNFQQLSGCSKDGEGEDCAPNKMPEGCHRGAPIQATISQTDWMYCILGDFS